MRDVDLENILLREGKAKKLDLTQVLWYILRYLVYVVGFD